MIAFECPDCGKPIKVRDELSGKRGKCPLCGRSLTVPVLIPEADRPAAEGTKKAEEKQGTGRLTKIVATVSGAVLAPIVVGVAVKWLDPSLWRSAPATQPLATPSTGPPPQERPTTSERQPLFNGKDLEGWEGREKYWSVKDGVIVGKNTEPVKVSTYLLTKRRFSDFRLVFDFKLAQSEMHSGIALWGRVAPERGDPYTYAGLLVMFPSDYGFYDLYGREVIHGNAAKAKKVGKQHDWNHMEILAQGNRVRFVLNGELISDWREPMPDRIKEAPIGLQLHANPKPQEVQFKGLVLETFPEDKLTTLKGDGDK